MTSTEDIKTTEKNTIIRNEVERSPAFIEEVDPIQLLETLDDCILALSGDPSQEIIDSIRNKLKRYEFVTLNDNGSVRWITEPFRLRKMTEKRPMVRRITHLLKTGGEWKSELVHRNAIEFASWATVPLGVTITNQAKEDMMNDRVSPLFVALTYIHQLIVDMLEGGLPGVGVFRKPNGVIAMNQLRSWLVSNDEYGPWTMKDELNVVSLHELAASATFSITAP